MLGSETRPRNGDEDRDVVAAGAGDEIEKRIEVADQRHRALVEGDALAEDRQPAADELEAADRLDAGHRAGQPHRAAELGVEAAATHEDAGAAR